MPDQRGVDDRFRFTSPVILLPASEATLAALLTDPIDRHIHTIMGKLDEWGDCGDPIACLVFTGRGEYVCDHCGHAYADENLLLGAISELFAREECQLSDDETAAADRRGVTGEFKRLIRSIKRRRHFTVMHELSHHHLERSAVIQAEPVLASRRTGARSRAKGCAGTRTRGSRRSVSRSSSRGGDSGDPDSSEGDGEPAVTRPHLHLVPDLPPRARRTTYSFGCLSAEERGAEVGPLEALQ